MTSILGISAFYHDSAAALVVDGRIVAAAQEERFTRKKNDDQFPRRAIEYCLSEADLDAAGLDFVAFYDKPLTKFERLLETYLAYAPAGYRSFRQAMPVWLKQKLHLRREMNEGLGGQYRGQYLFTDHHESHAASAFFPSPFDEAAILTLDGVGEWSTTCLGVGRRNRIELTHELRFPHSLGLLYSAFTYYTGFKVNSGEYKVMGLAPYGRPIYKDVILDKLMDLKADGSFRMDMSYFNYCQGLTMTSEKFHRLFGGPPREPESRLTQRDMDLAASVQAVTEEVMLRTARHLHEQTGLKNLVMAGGVALNCVGNGRVLREGPFENVWVQPAAGDAGGALGAALFVWHQLLDQPRATNGRDSQQGSFLGPRFTSHEIRTFLDQVGARYHQFDAEDELLVHTAEALAAEKVVGWFHGRMEYGPRALGARSILGDPRSPRMQATMNLKIKFRESFRPFAPCVLREHVHEWFGMRPNEDSPYMLLVAPVLEQRRLAPAADDSQDDADLVRRVNQTRSQVPAITHVDYSARAQTVDERHGRFYRLMRRFHEQTGCPIVVNTSFNLSWEPIVASPQEAYQAFMQSAMDVLVLEDFVLHKSEQPLGLRFVDSVTPVPARTNADSPWADPVSRAPLVVTATSAHDSASGANYPVIDGIPCLFVPHEPLAAGQDVTEVVKQYYEQTPLPNYDNLDNPRALIEQARAGLFDRLLNEQIPYGARVLEVGCGTGQLTNFLSIAQRTVLGIDLCLNSLRLAQRFKQEHGLERAGFAQMNLFRPALKDDFFDVVISNGVLHHTSDCRGAFERIARLVRPGGLLVVGLYSAYSRKLHQARRTFFRWTGLTNRWRDPHFGRVSADGKGAPWFQGRYRQPHETSHTLDELLGWMESNDLEFVNSIPKPVPGPTLTPDERLFEPRSAGSGWSRFLSQAANLGSGDREGGCFIVISRRREAGQAGGETAYQRSRRNAA